MYKWANPKHIGHDDMPDFQYMKTPPKDAKEETDALLREQWQRLKDYIPTWVEEEPIGDTTKRRTYHRRWQFVILVQLGYMTGMRLKEMINLKWSQISSPRLLSGINKEIYMDIYIEKL